MAGSNATSTSKKMCTKGPEDNKVEKPQLTACQRMRLLMKNNDRENKKSVLSDNQAIKDAIRENPNAKTLNAIVRMRVVGCSRHSFDETNLIRLHLVDADFRECRGASFDLQGKHSHRAAICELFATATLFNAENISDDVLPKDGSVVKSSTAQNQNYFPVKRRSW
ncbi:hypothetical protein V7S43_010200 [Phytophthora oleae]|uniref:Uncharacterized protein n=1 Tax=Phytophthora oleae TaxID=2107226 RepID=A0ABD3FDK5_9STRA